MRLIARLLVIAAAVWIVAAVVPGVHVQDGITSYLIIAVIFAIVNVLVRPVLLLFSLPFLVITLGLFLLVVNAALLGITAALTSRLSIDGFGSAVVAALLITMVTWAGDNALGLKKN
jgi:putative membrane protein